MNDYDYIHQASNERLAELLEPIGLDLGVNGDLEACAVIGEAARRLREKPKVPFNFEAFE